MDQLCGLFYHKFYVILTLFHWNQWRENNFLKLIIYVGKILEVLMSMKYQ
jgi:hypothetical protein